VVVREWHDRVGARFHDDYQGLENWSDLRDVLEEFSEAGISSTFDREPVYRGVAFDAWGGAYEVTSEKPLYYLVRRGPGPGTVDTSLLAQAREHGVDVRFGDRARTADGATVLAAGPHVAHAIAVGYVFETEMPDGHWVCFDDALAPGGYAYLLVHAGRGTVASCMFGGFKREAEYVERTIAMFRRRAGLRMRNMRRFGGFANFRLPRTAIQGGRPVVGEQAGFQDALAGFGIRYAVRSAVLAARSLIEGKDYRDLWRRELMPCLRASVVNRFLFAASGDRGRRWMLDRLSRGDARSELHRLYRPSPIKTILFPVALWRFHARLRDPSCDHIDCTCVWCRCRGEASAAPLEGR
jgi:flavin-dependent dehydrogenase